VPPNVPGLDPARRVLYTDVLSAGGASWPPGTRFVVVGGSMIGLAVADLLAGSGGQVTIVDPGRRLAADLYALVAREAVRLIEENPLIRVMLEAEPVEARDGTLTVRTADGEMTIEFERLVAAGARETRIASWNATAGTDAEVYAVGDRLRPGLILDAVHGAYRLALAVGDPRLEERLAIDNEPCTQAELVELAEELAPAVDAMDRAAAAASPPEDGPTYFEIVTAMAMLHFARRDVDVAVLEVGLGGRLDSTNVCRPVVSVITSISLDHTRQLGTTLESIAGEKAGIVKPGVPVVSGVTEPGPREVIREVCRRQGCRLVELGISFDFRYRPPQRLDLAPAMGSIDFHHDDQGVEHPCRDVRLALLGRHQAANAAVAVAALVELRQNGWEVPEKAVRDALGDLRWPARVELLARRPAVVIDAAHNVASIEALLSVLDESFSPRRRLLVFATTHEKDVRGILSRLLGKFDEVFLTRYLNNPRAVPPEDLRAVATELTGRECWVCPTPAEAWDQARAAAGCEDLICVTGSFFIAAEIRHLLLAGSQCPLEELA
jgi:dihydrofolate synthase/folylpolyglutamate synthase